MKKIILCLIGLMLTNCASVLDTSKVKLNTERNEIYNALGKPDTETKTEACWIERDMADPAVPGNLIGRFAYCVSFDENNKVNSYKWNNMQLYLISIQHIATDVNININLVY